MAPVDTASIKHVVVLCHPREASFNASVAERYCETVRGCGQTATLRDLYKLGFDPVLKAEEQPTSGPRPPSEDVARELAAIADARIIVLVYPIWFGMPPAMMKGYIDRVLGSGVPYAAVRDRTPNATFGGKRLLSFTSSATTTQWLEEQGALTSLRTLLDDYLRHALSLAGTRHIHFPSIVPGLKRRFVDENLLKVEQTALLECGQLRSIA